MRERFRPQWKKEKEERERKNRKKTYTQTLWRNQLSRPNTNVYFQYPQNVFTVCLGNKIGCTHEKKTNVGYCEGIRTDLDQEIEGSKEFLYCMYTAPARDTNFEPTKFVVKTVFFSIPNKFVVPWIHGSIQNTGWCGSD